MENKERGVIEEEKRAIDSQIADIDEQLEQLSRRENWNSRPPEHGKTVALVNGFEAFEAFAALDSSKLKKFPASCLPPILEDYSNQIEESLQVVNQMIGPALLGVVSICIRGESLYVGYK